jgi:hypothetical protein
MEWSEDEGHRAPTLLARSPLLQPRHRIGFGVARTYVLFLPRNHRMQPLRR